ncbi:RND membrane fusion protein AcrA [Moraxella macacae 0408225]|uniref:RND membrane fusion protein AcrA n=1 Tax=Moraxella macacae 0408225 TaxID=1230338 RepID=L2F4U0_9GAMM|nr:efflux RND transporter periplasmic adaptor subunit [Moraxella macacae]ELA08027.1 RND membrane fusion protein AcrA [Moraxella macacae 0408225]
MKYPVLLMVALASSVMLVGCNQSDKAGDAVVAQQQMPQATVNVMPVEFQTIPLIKELSGKITPYQEALVLPQITGMIDKQLFREGSFVKQGQALYQINADNYASSLAGSKATYNQALASISTAQATLKTQQANLNLANQNLSRLQTLKDTNAISQQEYDIGVANVETARLAVESAQAQITAAKANATVAKQAINSNQLNHNRTRVTAPISGITSLNSANVGSLATTGQTQLTTISQLNPIYVDISQSVAELLALRQQFANGNVSQANRVSVRLKLPDGSIYPDVGQLHFEEAKVDSNTGTVNLRAVFNNDDYMLLPGMMVNARLTQGSINHALLLPQSAITRTPKGDSTVYIVDDQQKIQVRPVQIQGTYEGQWIITSGLKQGENVVITGGAKVKPDQLVKTLPYNPTPKKSMPTESMPTTSEPINNAKVAPKQAKTPTTQPASTQQP